MTSGNDGLVIVDKPGGLTSHDVVARIRRLAGTRKVGHAGTLDPMATGVLVVGVERATRLLGYLTLTEKQYDATIRLGQSTSTDDAEGEITGGAPAAGVSAEAVSAAIVNLTGEIQQVPPVVSAIKVDGQRAYKLTRAGAAPELKPRPVTVYEFTVTAIRPVPGDGLLDVDATVRCSSGTYIRALARDLGAALGTGGHLTALRRTRVGGYGLAAARTLDQLAERFEVVPLAQAAAAAFPRRDLSADEARRLAHGGRLTAIPAPPDPDRGGQLAAVSPPPGPDHPTAAFAPDGSLVALLTEQSGQARPLVVFVGS
jgi:tRNA pseudouridine55 synthase